GGNAMGCAAALATIEVLTADGFMDAVRARGEQLWSGLRELQGRHDGVVDVRGPGLMVAAQFDTAARTSAVVSHCLQHGKLITMTAGSAGTTMRFMPPLTVSADEIDLALAALDKAHVDAA
ncbi:MAG: aminotransferase class III-fold pyridoxal phosphate-dependent enzyme, partial [Ilumatobacter sp.]|uniref:aminotransferase class III-fold pyridoxal phosphate-dependent enzyme n=1 Tax=Ilumatobacter sp. TaxID=1967498 RepID=UPI0032982AE4